jgi:hypothetical protein
MRAILDACDEAGPIPDRRVRSAIVSAAMLTVAQTLDGNDLPAQSQVLKPGGIAAGLANTGAALLLIEDMLSEGHRNVAK